MLLISHRGNIDHIDESRENSISYILEAINLGYDVEIDVRLIDNKLFLGHDEPQYEVDLSWLQLYKDKLWVHTKNFNALSYLIDYNLRVFYHQKENHTIINNCNIIWSHDLSEANEKSIIPLLSMEDIKKFNYKNVYGICSDFIDNCKF